ncbi:NlpC/P60 family protein [Actinoallomurus purpureus]|uniref:C40 family peptidase n=1 Tax=Actinoallomurus purpureus TaxID=478114 RepID=UPI002092195A|nr:NlpC/P60 family protein [Actinoallomurus purpureus]MCO6004844.1 NlpC/P60 family protein [Actinoallomurus purpureus]
MTTRRLLVNGLSVAAVSVGIAALSGCSSSHVQSTSASKKVTVHNFVAADNLDGRAGKSLNAKTVKVDQYKKGQKVPVVCQDPGEFAYGSAIWDKTTAGTWVTDVYVKTGHTGYATGVPRCSTGTSGTGGGSTSSGGNTPGASNCYSSAAVHGRNNGTSGSRVGSASARINRVISIATAETKKVRSYSWGAGGKGGASCGISSLSPGGYADYRRYGFDCSGLTLYAFYKGAGIDIGADTTQQYSRGPKKSWSSLRKGDLIFWGSGDNIYSTTHVALYIGNNKIIEAAPPRASHSVHITTLYGSGRHTAHVVRFIQ